MLVLGIETSCDETGIAVVKNGNEILSNVVATQEKLHSPFGGVVPELAARRHVDILPSLLNKALCIPLEEIDIVSVTHGPGLIGALLVGVHFAQGLAFSISKPLVGINHIEAHLYSSLMHADVPLPALGILISGGHTALVCVHAVGRYSLIGQTQDDAIGEAFDKAAQLLGLSYPGGPKLEQLAKGGNPKRFVLKAGLIKDRPFDFSFSGLKTALLYLIRGQNGTTKSVHSFSEEEKKDAAASFQHAAFSDLVRKACNAAKQYNCKSLLVGGGVSQNKYVRFLLEKKSHLPVFWPPEGLCLDNGAMIAGLGYHIFQQQGSVDALDVDPQLKIAEGRCYSYAF